MEYKEIYFMPFKTGTSGNPAGRPSGIGDKRMQLSKLLQPHAEQIINKIIDLALNGNMDALRLCMERLIPKIKNEPINFELPEDLSNTENLLNSNASLINAVASGAVTVEGAEALSALIDSHCKLMLVNDYAKRIEALEKVLQDRQEDERLKSTW
jgi:hypothetical protein